MTNRRVNAIEHVIIPKTENTIKYIQQELEELDREDFVRLKKVQSKKQQHKEIEEAANAKKDKQQQQENGTGYEVTNVMADAEQEDDVIF